MLCMYVGSYPTFLIIVYVSVVSHTDNENDVKFSTVYDFPYIVDKLGT
jgi:hypothetical protein